MPASSGAIDLGHWLIMRCLTVSEAALLIAGGDPEGKVGSSARAAARLIERRIVECIEAARQRAHEWGEELYRLEMLEPSWSAEDRARFDRLRDQCVAWEGGANWASELPTLEIRAALQTVSDYPGGAAVFSYSPLSDVNALDATISGAELNAWLARAEINSKFVFSAEQRIEVFKFDWKFSDADDVFGRRIRVDHGAEGEQQRDRLRGAAADVGTKERNSLLAIIYVLAKMGDVDIDRHAKAAGVIASKAAELGLEISESTIELHLKRVKEAVAGKTK